MIRFSVIYKKNNRYDENNFPIMSFFMTLGLIFVPAPNPGYNNRLWKGSGLT